MRSGWTCGTFPGELVPTRPEEIASFIQLWTRESSLLGFGLYISAEDVVEPAVQKSIRQLIEKEQQVRPLFLGTD